MTTFFNRDNGEFAPYSYQSDIAFGHPEDAPQQSSSLYYRTKSYPELTAEVEACVRGDRDVRGLSLDAYQAWNETGWKEPHGSKAFADRLRGKFQEEHAELDRAIGDWWDDSALSTQVIDELGDNLWLSVAAANNAGALVSDSIKLRLFNYAAGTRMVEHGNLVYPEWYDFAGRLAIKRGPVTFGDLDELASEKFVPQMSPAMNIYEDMRGFGMTSVTWELRMIYGMLYLLSKQQHESEHTRHTSGSRSELAKEVGKLTAEAVLRYAGIAHRVGATLSQTAISNVTKINNRIDAKLVDKADGQRK